MAMQLFVDGEVLAVQINQKHSLSCSLLEISDFFFVRLGLEESCICRQTCAAIQICTA